MINENSTKAEVLEAVKLGGYALQFASAALKADKEVVLKAVSRNGLALQYASAALKGDRDVVKAAVRQNGESLCFASNELQIEMAKCWLERMEHETKND